MINRLFYKENKYSPVQRRSQGSALGGGTRSSERIAPQVAAETYERVRYYESHRMNASRKKIL